MNRCTLKLFNKFFVITLVTLLTCPTLSFAKRRVLDKTVVAVNDDIILESDIDRFLEKAKSKSFKELFGGISNKKLGDRKIVLQLLIEEKIIDQKRKTT